MARLLPGFTESETQMSLFESTPSNHENIEAPLKEQVILNTKEELERIMDALLNQDEIVIDIIDNILTLETSDKIYKAPYIASTSLTSGT
jgi:hypothetical protein